MGPHASPSVVCTIDEIYTLYRSALIRLRVLLHISGKVEQETHSCTIIDDTEIAVSCLYNSTSGNESDMTE